MKFYQLLKVIDDNSLFELFFIRNGDIGIYVPFDEERRRINAIEMNKDLLVNVLNSSDATKLIYDLEVINQFVYCDKFWITLDLPEFKK